MFSFLGNFFVKLVANVMKRWFQDKANRDLGASQERERQKDAALEIRDEHAKIDATHVPADNAYASFLRNAAKNNRDRKSSVSNSDSTGHSKNSESTPSGSG